MEQAKENAANRERLSLEAQLPMQELMAGARPDIEAIAAERASDCKAAAIAAELNERISTAEAKNDSCGA